MRNLLPQRCPVAVLYLNWLLFLGVAVFFAVQRQLVGLIVWIVAAPPAMWAYVRVFPRISAVLGYGSVADQAPESPGRSAARVTMYTGIGCPFCPIMEQRLRALQPVMGFELDVVEVTGRPDLVRRKRIGSVPVIEVEDRRRAGCMTTQELSLLIAGTAPAKVAAPSGAAAG